MIFDPQKGWGSFFDIFGPPPPPQKKQKIGFQVGRVGGGGVQTKNSIAFGSAPRREVDSQPIIPLARPAVSQTGAHSLGFLSMANAAPSSGEIRCPRPSSGRMVMQLPEVFLSAV